MCAFTACWIAGITALPSFAWITNAWYWPDVIASWICETWVCALKFGSKNFALDAVLLRRLLHAGPRRLRERVGGGEAEEGDGLDVALRGRVGLRARAEPSSKRRRARHRECGEHQPAPARPVNPNPLTTASFAGGSLGVFAVSESGSSTSSRGSVDRISGAPLAHDDVVLEADAAEAGAVEARLDREDHPGRERRRRPAGRGTAARGSRARSRGPAPCRHLAEVGARLEDLPLRRLDVARRSCPARRRRSPPCCASRTSAHDLRAPSPRRARPWRSG